MLPSKLQGGLMSAKRMEPSAGHHQLRRRKAARLEQPVIEPLHSLAHIDLGRPSCGGFEPPRVRNVVALVARPPILEPDLRLFAAQRGNDLQQLQKADRISQPAANV